MKVAGVAGVVDDRLEAGAARRDEVDDGGSGVGAVEHTVRSAVDLDVALCRRGDSAEVKAAAYVFRSDAIDEYFIGVRVSAANEE